MLAENAMRLRKVAEAKAAISSLPGLSASWCRNTAWGHRFLPGDRQMQSAWPETGHFPIGNRVSKLLKARMILTPSRDLTPVPHAGPERRFRTHDWLQILANYEGAILDTHRQIRFLMYTYGSGSNLGFNPTEEATHGNYGASR